MINLYYWLYSLFPKPVPWLVTATEDTLYPFCSLWRPFKHRENNDKYQFHNISYNCIISRVVFTQKFCIIFGTLKFFEFENQKKFIKRALTVWKYQNRISGRKEGSDEKKAKQNFTKRYSKIINITNGLGQRGFHITVCTLYVFDWYYDMIYEL